LLQKPFNHLLSFHLIPSHPALTTPTLPLSPLRPYHHHSVGHQLLQSEADETTLVYRREILPACRSRGQQDLGQFLVRSLATFSSPIRVLCMVGSHRPQGFSVGRVFPVTCVFSAFYHLCSKLGRLADWLIPRPSCLPSGFGLPSTCVTGVVFVPEARLSHPTFPLTLSTTASPFHVIGTALHISCLTPPLLSLHCPTPPLLPWKSLANPTTNPVQDMER